MTFAAPLFVWAAAAVGLLTIGLHLLAWRRPPATPLPTARFAPDAPVRTVARALRPTDLLLLALRVALILLAGAALGRPTLRSRTPGRGRVIVVDASRGAQVNAAVSDSARAHFRPADVLVTFDSTARERSGATADSIRAATTQRVAGSVSAGLIAGIRAALRLAGERDSVEIVIASPFDGDEMDAATAAIRQRWRGSVRAVRVAVPPNDPAATGRVVVRATAGDPVAAAVALGGQARAGGDVRVVRDALTPGDSAWAQEGQTVVVWPATAPSSWPLRARADTAFAVSTVGPLRSARTDDAAATVVASFARTVAPPPGRVAARWQDGEPAATERALGAGCIRAVAVTVPAAGDLALTPAFRRLSERLTAPCANGTRSVPVSDSVLAFVLPAAIPSGAGAQPSVGIVDARASRLTAWMLALALVAALAELAVRRGATNATA
jgi:aerotolerance regulator-like protein